MTSSTQNPKGKPEQPIEFTIDGRTFTTTEPHQTAAALLQLTGLDPNGHDLAEFHGNQRTPKRFKDDQKVRVQDGDRFVSIRERATVA